MREDGHWGGFTELMAYAEKFCRSVRLYVENPRCVPRSMQMHACVHVYTHTQGPVLCVYIRA
jgi:hypothetical protein